jgi:hypothetical protein
LASQEVNQFGVDHVQGVSLFPPYLCNSLSCTLLVRFIFLVIR